MKIIKKGMTNWASKPKRFYCRRCHCTFEADNNEYIRSSTVDVFQYQVNCPNCNLLITRTEEKREDDD